MFVDHQRALRIPVVFPVTSGITPTPMPLHYATMHKAMYGARLNTIMMTLKNAMPA